MRDYEFETYQVGTRVPPLLEENDTLLREDVGLQGDAGELLKSEFNREVGKRIGQASGAEVGFERPDIQLLIDLATDDIDVEINSAFIYGRYRKLERDIPQTEWPCRECHETGIKRGEPCPGCDGTGYRYDESVEELTAPVVTDAMAGSEAVFHGAGREDVDARMLGTGRPFVIEVAEPRVRDVDIQDLEGSINEFADGKVEVDDLAPATYEMVERVKELDASKRYRMDVEFDAAVEGAELQSALETLDGATIEQDTPDRVSHRRAALTRTREVYEATGELTDTNHAELEIHGAGGLYVKELVSGDEGRTRPSLHGELGVGATVTALDVLAVRGETENFVQAEYIRE
jgi:tRNA pseudouridine synthase 10